MSQLNRAFEALRRETERGRKVLDASSISVTTIEVTKVNFPPGLLSAAAMAAEGMAQIAAIKSGTRPDTHT